MDEYEAIYDGLTNKKKNLVMRRGGVFVLLTNRKIDCRIALSQFSENIKAAELLLKTAFEDAAPSFHPQPREVLEGKMMLTAIEAIIRKEFQRAAEKAGLTVPEMTGRLQSLMCACSSKSKTAVVEAPLKQVKDIFQALDIPIPVQLDLEAFRKGFLAEG